MLITAISFSVNAQSENMEDVVYLKNGSIIRGIIVEQIPNESLKVKTKDGSVFVYKMTEVDKLTKEQIVNTRGNSGNFNNSRYPYIASPSYKQIKMDYDYHMYVPQLSDPYNPTVSGICSWIIPGLGQMVCGETGRGLGFLGGYIGSYLVVGIGSAIFVSSSSYSYYGSYYSTNDHGGRTAGSLFMVAGIIGMVAVDIWSIVDATHVAKVKNMYISDMRSKTSSLKLEVSPYIDQISMNNEIVRPVGLTMRVKF